jgi:hypothetical protein
MGDIASDAFMPERGRAKLNPTVAALMQRGFDNQMAHELHAAGLTLDRLKTCDAAALKKLGLSDAQVAAIHGGQRAALPFANLAKVLWSNRFTCCVCRNAALAVIVHHIDPWATSRDHSVDNLAVLCLEHHARAHRKGDLEQNLTPRQLKEFKSNWERDVAHLDPKAILEASRIPGHPWWWFNHVRLFEMAHQLRLDLTRNSHYLIALSAGVIDGSSLPRSNREKSSYMYQGGDGIRLYAYVREVLEAVLARTAVFNISDVLDPGFLSRIVSVGDIILVEGKHYFRSVSKVREGPGQASEVRREANNVRVHFTVDRWEAVATSAWAVWLAGSKPAASLVRVQSIEREGGKLHLHCTGLAIGSTLQGLSTRSYLFATWKEADDDDEDELGDDWLNGFGEDEEPELA